MKDKTEDLRDELNRVMKEHAEEFPNTPTVFPQELIERVVAYVWEQRNHGVSLRQCSQRVNLSHSRLHYWVYSRVRRDGGQNKRRLKALRPVEVSSKIVKVADGIPEPRFTVCSPTGWEVKDLRLEELTLLLRSLH